MHKSRWLATISISHKDGSAWLDQQLELQAESNARYWSRIWRYQEFGFIELSCWWCHITDFQRGQQPDTSTSQMIWIHWEIHQLVKGSIRSQCKESMAIQAFTQTPCRVKKYPTNLFHIRSFSTVVDVSVELFVKLTVWPYCCCCCLLYLSCQTSPSLSCNISSLSHSYLGRGRVWGRGGEFGVLPLLISQIRTQ